MPRCEHAQVAALSQDEVLKQPLLLSQKATIPRIPSQRCMYAGESVLRVIILFGLYMETKRKSLFLGVAPF